MTAAFKDLSYYAKYILIAAYLASHNPPRLDTLYFSHGTEAVRKRRRKQQRKSKGDPATPGSTPRRQRAVQRRLLGAQPFALERLLAVLHAVVPHGVPHGSADVLGQVATLGALRMLARVPAGGDVVDVGATKWRCAVGPEFVRGVAREVGFELDDYLAE